MTTVIATTPQNRGQVLEILDVTAAVVLTPYQRTVYAVPPAASTYIVTLCSADSAGPGAIVTVVSKGNDVGTVTVAAPGQSDVILTADLDVVMYYSDGRKWHSIKDVST